MSSSERAIHTRIYSHDFRKPLPLPVSMSAHYCFRRGVFFPTTPRADLAYVFILGAMLGLIPPISCFFDNKVLFVMPDVRDFVPAKMVGLSCGTYYETHSLKPRGCIAWTHIDRNLCRPYGEPATRQDVAAGPFPSPNSPGLPTIQTVTLISTRP